MAKWTMYVGIFTGCLVVTSLIGNLFIYLQYYTATNVQIETREQLRALVTNPSVLVVVPDDLDKSGGVVAVVPTFQNFGGTRTHRFKAVISLKYFDGVVPNNLDVTKPYLKVESADTVIGPNSNYQMQVAMPAEDMKKAKNDLGQILFWGTAEYSDIFDTQKVHHINICNLLKPQTTPEGKIVVQSIPYRPDCNRSD